MPSPTTRINFLHNLTWFSIFVDPLPLSINVYLIFLQFYISTLDLLAHDSCEAWGLNKFIKFIIWLKYNAFLFDYIIIFLYTYLHYFCLDIKLSM